MTALLLIAACVSSAYAGDDGLARIRRELGTLRAELEHDGSRLQQARERVFELERGIATHQQQQQRLVEQIEHKRARIDELKAARSKLEGELARARALLARNTAARYALASQPRLKLLLNQDQAASLSRNLAYYDYVMRSYDRDLVTLFEQLQALDDTRGALKLENNSLRQLRQHNAAELERLQLTHEEHRALIAAIEKRMDEGNNRIHALAEDEHHVVALVQQIERSAPAAEGTFAFGKHKGRLDWPTAGRVSKAPGRALREGGARWSGVLIDGTPGTKVHAVADGRVVFADWFRNLGRLIIVDHGDGYMSLYGNNAEVFKNPGDRVSAGDTIATVGNGVGDMPAGLYFELRERGQPVDPRDWCVRR